MIKIVVICLFAILLSNCTYTPATAARSAIITKPCEIAVVDPAIGKLKAVVEANEENWYKNKPICDAKFEQINKYADK